MESAGVFVSAAGLIGIQVSLRELLLIVALVSVGLASLKVGGLLATCFVIASLLLFMAATITAIVDRGLRQKFAIGMVVAAGVYALVILGAAASRPPVTLPMSQWLSTWYEAIAERAWVDSFSGKELPGFDPDRHGLNGVRLESEHPDRATFRLVGHILWAFAFGYAGGKFAQHTYAHRDRDSEAAEPPSDPVSAQRGSE
jgi:hypothetical protein